MSQVSLNIDETKVFMRHIVNNNRHLQKQGKNRVSVEISGDSGLGKTSAVLQLAKELNFNFVKLNLAQIEEIGDLVGFPIRQFEMQKTSQAVRPVAVSAPAVSIAKKPKTIRTVIDGKLVDVPVDSPAEPVTEATLAVQVEEHEDGTTRWVDEQMVQEYAKQGYTSTGEKRMSYCPPEWIASKSGGGFLILDDWNRADTRFIQAVMELVDRQEYISWKLPDDWHIILTANPDDGDYLVQSIDTAQRTRFVRINLKFDKDVWAQWAEESKVDGRCINFLLLHPELVVKDINPRSITTFFNAISSINDFDKNLPLIEMIGEGSVGEEFANMFASFIHNKLDRLPTPQELLLDGDDASAIRKIKSVVIKGDDYRADIASVLTHRIVNYLIMYSATNKITEEINRRIIHLISDEKALTNDLKYYFTRQVVVGNKIKFGKLLENHEIVKYIVK